MTSSPSTAEDEAAEYFFNRVFMGMFAPRPPVERWRPDQRERFERELARLEDERTRQRDERTRQRSEAS